jgi:hypothetical protein
MRRGPREGELVRLSKWPVSAAVTVIAVVVAPRLLVGLLVAIPIAALLTVLSPAAPRAEGEAIPRNSGPYVVEWAKEVADRGLLLPELAFISVILEPQLRSVLSASTRRSIGAKPVELRVLALLVFGAILGYLGQRLWSELPWFRRFRTEDRVDAGPQSRVAAGSSAPPSVGSAGHRFGEAIYLGVAAIPLFALGTPWYSSAVVGLLYLCPVVLARVGSRRSSKSVYLGLVHRAVAHWAFVVSRPTHGGSAG